VNNDAIATAQLMGEATSRIQVGTWIANIYLRHSYTCAQGAALIADATGGRFVLGLGVSHQPVNRALGIAMPDPLGELRRYVGGGRRGRGGEGPATRLPQRPAPVPVPLYLAAMTSPAVELGGGTGRRDHAAVLAAGAGGPEQRMGRPRPGQGPGAGTA